MLPLAWALNIEFVPARMRSTIVTIIMMGYSFGTAVAAPMTNWIAPHYGWQGVYLTGGIGTLLCAAALWLKLPESVRFLVTKGLKPELVARTLRQMDPAGEFTSADRFILSDEVKVERQFHVSDLFRGNLRLITPLLWLGYTASSLAIYLVASWGPIVLEDLRFPRPTSALVTSLGGLLGAVAGLALMRFTGPLRCARRGLLSRARHSSAAHAGSRPDSHRSVPDGQRDRRIADLRQSFRHPVHRRHFLPERDPRQRRGLGDVGRQGRRHPRAHHRRGRFVERPAGDTHLCLPGAVSGNTVRVRLRHTQDHTAAHGRRRAGNPGFEIVTPADRPGGRERRRVILPAERIWRVKHAMKTLPILLLAVFSAPIATRTDAAEPWPAASRAHFHHVHLNVTDPKATIAFYKKFFGASDVSYRGLSDGLFTEKSFILLTQVQTAPPTNMGTSLWHIGWAGVEGESEFAWRTREGIGVQTPATPFGRNFYMYFWGPNREVIEIWTASKNHRFEHVHLLATHLGATLSWFQEHLGLAPLLPAAQQVTGVATNYIRVDNVSISVMERPANGQPRPSWWPDEAGDTYPPTDGTAIDHIAFSFTDIRPVFRRMQRTGVAVVHPVAKSREYGLTSFFVRGPDGLLVEIVQEAPIPEGIWQTKP